MRRNVLEYLEEAAAAYPDKRAFFDEKESLTFRELWDTARSVGGALRAQNRGGPVAICMKRSPRMIAAFLGAIYSGKPYIPLEEEMGRHRIELILRESRSAVLVCDESAREALSDPAYAGLVLSYEDLCRGTGDAGLAEIRSDSLDTDPLYVVFTSGSTGVPKGVVACHRNVIDYIEALSAVLRADETTVFGMQVPLYVDACLKEIWLTVKHGASTCLIPKQHFLFPLRLIDYMNRCGVNTVCWVVSALTIISGLGALSKDVPRLRTVAFGSEVFPVKQFALWREALPEARFLNLYGPTECTGMSCFYEVDRDFGPEDAIPIGRPFANTEILLIDGERRITAPGETGEIYIRGAGVTLGYFNDRERTAEVFVRNPLHSAYPEIVYRTGDLARYNERGELVYVARRDHQIKHMGYRVELPEIESAAGRAEGVDTACCVFDAARDKIVLYYTGPATEDRVAGDLRRLLPRYMEPAHCLRRDALPLLNNGKVNRALLTELAEAL
jgi:amino acid adenylation domain-containing protein